MNKPADIGTPNSTTQLIALFRSGRYVELEQFALRALNQGPESGFMWKVLGVAQQMQGKDALQALQNAAKLLPNDAEAHSNLANALRDAGRLEEALHAYEAAIAIKPDFAAAHYRLSQFKTYHSGDPHQAMLEQANVATLTTQDRIQFCFTLGKVYEDLGLYDESFSVYAEGNRLQSSQLRWDEKTEEDVFARTMATFSKEYFATHPHSGYADKTPIFIVGMPRSGTSLIEQILSSYPGVYGAGELPDLSYVVTHAMPSASIAHFPEAVTHLTSTTLESMGRQYLGRIKQHAQQAIHVIDKMSANFLYIGMIRQMLPQAKIIHVMRDPMDSCFSCYSRLFADGNLPFSYGLESLGRHYRRYIELMRHWHAVLPAGSILDLRYEEMVADTEGQARRLLDYLGLSWDASCLDFYRNQHQLKTASGAQARQAIYQTSLARWERYANHLQPLYELVKTYRDR